jgi:hypothetical protein
VWRARATDGFGELFCRALEQSSEAKPCARWRRWVGQSGTCLVIDDRILCTDCRELRRNGDCLAARERRRLDVSEYYGHGAIDLPWRCEFFAPKPGAADQRSGRERYPTLYAEYEAAQARRNGFRREAAVRGIERAKAAIEPNGEPVA